MYPCTDVLIFVQDHLRLRVAADRKGSRLMEKVEGDRQVAPTKRKGAG